MRLRSIGCVVGVVGVAGVVLGTVGVSAGQADKSKLKSPAALAEQALGDLQGRLRHEQGGRS